MNPVNNYAPWVDDFSTLSTKERKEKIESILAKVSDMSDEASSVIKSLTNPKEFEKLSALGYLHYAPKDSKNPEEAAHLRFTKPVIAMKHKRLPLIMAVGEELPEDAKFVSIDAAKDSMGVPQLLSYSKTLSKMSEGDKNKLRDLCIVGIKTYRRENSAKDWLSDYLSSNKDFSFKGFALNLPYINVDPAYGDTKSFWIHAWGTPQLLFTHKRLPVMIIVGPSVRLDKNVLGDTNMTGFTG